MQGAKRFYDTVTLRKDGHVYCVLLDEKTIVNNGVTLRHASIDLMHMIVDEWNAQKDYIAMDTMPYTRLLYSFLFINNETRQLFQTTITDYIRNDTLYYHAEADSALAKKQLYLWEPWVNWASSYFEIELQVTHHIMPIHQSETSLAAIARWLENQDNISILCLYLLSDTLKSFIISLALLEGKVSPQTAMDIAWLEHDSQAEQWGEDDDAAHKRKTALDVTKTVLQFYQWVK